VVSLVVRICLRKLAVV